MRTTLTIDEDNAQELERARRRLKTSFKEVLNEALRAGLLQLATAKPARRRAYRTKAVSLGTPRLPSLDDIAGVLEFAEGADR
jgi:hypothetical protein